MTEGAADPVSWLMIEQGWKVLSEDGEEVGKIEEVVGDSGRDIFDGLTIATGFFSRARYVPAEQVREIVDGAVRLSLSPAEVQALAEYDEPPPSERIRP